MAGTAQTNDFMLGTATVMLGPVEDLYNLTPDAHSIGLVKNFSLAGEPAFADLTQGVRNTLVFSTQTGNTLRATMEAYEFTSRNLAYGLGLDGANVDLQTDVGAVATAVTGGTANGTLALETGDGTAFAVNDYIMIDVNGDDNVIVRRVAAKTTDTLTVVPVFGTGVTIPVGAVVSKVNMLSMGSKLNMPFFSAKIVGRLADNTPIVVLIPKARITRGFTLAFSSEDYGNLPFELSVYDVVTSDPFYADFRTQSAKLFRA